MITEVPLIGPGHQGCNIDVRPDSSGSLGIAAELEGSRKLD